MKKPKRFSPDWLALHPQEVAYKIALADSVAKVPKPEEAMGILQDAIRLHPKTFTADIALAKLYSSQSAQRMQNIMETAYKRGGSESIDVLKEYFEGAC